MDTRASNVSAGGRNDLIPVWSDICTAGGRYLRFDTRLDGTGVLSHLVFGIGIASDLHRTRVAVEEPGK